MRNLEEIKKKNNNDKSIPALIVQENDDVNEFGGVVVWSINSEDDEVCRPTHGKTFVAK